MLTFLLGVRVTLAEKDYMTRKKKHQRPPGPECLQYNHKTTSEEGVSCLGRRRGSGLNKLIPHSRQPGFWRTTVSFTQIWNSRQMSATNAARVLGFWSLNREK